MEERYELREKIGQGGIGRVYRAYDHKMGREVAIKRILTSNEDPNLQLDATKQLLVEVSALASLQHPNIVTVYDVGTDDEGPYVVMELIAGKTLDEIVENAPLTWNDFKLVALQTLEALLAAQELDMIHSDLKPPNIMLTWLPSGAFQVKIVDFGLAVLIQNQSQEEIEKLEAIYGSVFFMPPEQYERKTLDTRSDLYSLGCCFYQALTGAYPFSGTTGMEVMQSHLNHSVIPIQEIRSDIPVWACNWLMWLINRYPDERPPSARDALANFLLNDKETNPVMSRGGETANDASTIIPTPETSAVSINHSPTPDIKNLTNNNPFDPNAHAKRKLTKQQLTFVAATVALILIATGWFVLKNNSGFKYEKQYNEIVNEAGRDDVKQILLSHSELQIVFDFINQSKPDAYLTPAYATLAKAQASDKETNFDTSIADFATSAKVTTSVRIKLFNEVIAIRATTTMAPILLKFVADAKNPAEAYAAFQSISPMIREENAESLLYIIAYSSHLQIKQYAESEMKKIITNSNNINALAAMISSANLTSEKPSSEQAFDRLRKECMPKPKAQIPPPSLQPKLQPTPMPPAQSSPARLVVPTSFQWGCDTVINSASIIDQNTGRTHFLECTLASPVETNPQVIYLKFHLIGVDNSIMSNANKVELQMFNSDTKATGVHTVKIYGLNNADNLDLWADHTMDITSAPAISDRVKLTLDTTKITELGSLAVDFNQLSANAPLPIFTSTALHDFLKTDTDKRVTLLITTESISAGGSTRFGIRSKEFSNGNLAPSLIFIP